MRSFYKKKVPKKTLNLRLVVKLFTILFFGGLMTHSVFGQNTNPVQAAEGFLVMVEGDAQLTVNETEAGIAIGGDLIIDNHTDQLNQTETASYKVDVNSGSNYMYGGKTVSLIVGGKVQYLGGASVSIPPDENIMLLGDCTGINISNPSAEVTQLKGTSAFPVININAVQDNASLCVSSPIDFSAAFSDFRSHNTCLSTKTANTSYGDQNGDAITNQNFPDSNTKVELTSGQENILNTTFTALNQIQNLNFQPTYPSATSPLIVNIDGGGASSISWNIATQNLSNAHAPYVIYNIYNVGILYLIGSQSLEGTLFAPNTKVIDECSGNVEGSIIAKELIHSGGEIHDYPFVVDLSCSYTACTTPMLTALTEESICEGERFTAANVTTNVSNGVAVDYQWYNNNGTDNPSQGMINGQTTNTLTALPTTAGSYSYKVVATDAANTTCEADQTVDLLIQELPTATVADVLKCTSNSETIVVSASGGSPTYTYNWSGPYDLSTQVGESFPTSMPGTYTVIVTDSEACTVTASGELTVQSKICLPVTFIIRRGKSSN